MIVTNESYSSKHAIPILQPAIRRLHPRPRLAVPLRQGQRHRRPRPAALGRDVRFRLRGVVPHLAVHAGRAGRAAVGLGGWLAGVYHELCGHDCDG